MVPGPVLLSSLFQAPSFGAGLPGPYGPSLSKSKKIRRRGDIPPGGIFEYPPPPVVRRSEVAVLEGPEDRSKGFGVPALPSSVREARFRCPWFTLEALASEESVLKSTSKVLGPTPGGSRSM